ncbi:Hypothetical predicted protein [Mytilus galloprovincialis]|uniref:DZIP3-like HEPN domain-containing protein n=1 Tax=Mytilus galloprovincialis TaxID=29158 RepID=A0A8B6HAH3_MYTGA|nr:Hypothetical predicted protein [Mytilus galloprovincialis]
MASISQLSEEERNFTRFFLLNFKVSPVIARRFFDGIFPPAYLDQTINRNMPAIISLNKSKRINAVQLDLLRGVPGTVWPSYFPPIPVGTNATSSNDFDLTMMICLLRNLGGLITPSNGWDQLPHPNDTLPGASMATLKWYRNQMAHATVTSMDNNAFTDEWTRVERALTSLNKGQIPHEITEILHYDLDGEKAKTLAIAEQKQLTKEYEKEKEQIESDFSYYREGNLPKNFADANENFVKTWITDDEIFYETKGTKLVYDKVKDNNCILVTSNSGLGKTATIRHIALKLKLERYEIVVVESPDDIIKYKTNKKQVFLIDDVLGKYDLSPTLMEEWERKNEKLKSCLKTEFGSTKILCTLRLQIALNKRFKNASTILNKVVINLERESNILSKEEKQKILMKHLGRSNFENEIKTEEIKKMCENKYAFPLLCKLVSNSKERFKQRVAFFRQPLSLFSEELDKMSIENNKLYCILVICMLYNGSLSSIIFDIYSKKCDKKINRIMQTCRLESNVSKKELEDSACSAVGSYFIRDRNNFRFIHDALEETVGCHFYTFDPAVMLSECDISFITDRIRVRSNENSPEIVGENIVIIKEDELNENHLEPLYNRLSDELSNGRFSTLLMSDLFKNRNFVRLFGTTFDNKHCTLKSKYTLLMKNSSEISRSVYKKTLDILSNDNKDNRDAISRVIRAIYGRRTLMYWIIAYSCHEFFQYIWNKMTKIERKWVLGRDYFNQHLVKSFFPLAVLGGSFDIVNELICSGADVNCFSEFGETPLYIAVKSGCCKMMRLLMENGAHVNLRRWFTMNIPILAASNKLELTSLILEYDLNQTELHKAVRRDDLESLRSKLRSEDIDWKTKSGWTVLHYAVLLNNLQAVEVLFHEELVQNHYSYFDFKQVHRVKVSTADNNGLTAVHLAVINNNIDILSILLRNKAEVKIRDGFDRTPLHYTTSGIATRMLVTHSTRKQCLENTRLLEKGREYNKTSMSAFRTTCFNITLHTALRNMCRDFVNMPDKEGNTALHSVIKSNILKEESHSCIDTLFENGANPFLVNNDVISSYGLIQSSFDTIW